IRVILVEFSRPPHSPEQQSLAEHDPARCRDGFAVHFGYEEFGNPGWPHILPKVFKKILLRWRWCDAAPLAHLDHECSNNRRIRLTANSDLDSLANSTPNILALCHGHAAKDCLQVLLQIDHKGCGINTARWKQIGLMMEAQGP